MREDLAAAVREFTDSLLNPYDLPELLYRLTGHASAVVDGCGAGIMLENTDGELGFVAASEERIVAAERHQERVESGACYEAYTRNELIAVDDLEADHRWPDYSARMKELGLRSVIGVPMNAFGRTIGVINIYRDAPSTWTPGDIDAAQIVASMGAGYIINANQMREQTDLADHLQSALDSRDVIGQAKGILMSRRGVDADAAFEALRAASQASNRKLRDVAQELLDRHRQG
jgi:GAF domain-containing protein